MTESEYKHVFEAYRMYVFYFCNKWLGQKEDAEDVTSDVFISLWHNKENVQATKAKAYLLVTANRKCQDKVRTNKNYNNRVNIYSLSDLNEVEINNEVLGYLAKLIEALPPQEKRMITLMYKDGKERWEIAKLLNLSPQTVSNTLHSAIKRLKVAFKKAHQE